jgi:quercetin dioxygenase-like cupin family protein
MILSPAMFPYITSVESGQWRPGPYPGVELLVLHKDPHTGGSTVLRKFHAGVTVPAHIHPEANESVYILSGEWEEAGRVHGPGTFFHAPKGQPHGPHFARTEVVGITVFDGPLTVRAVDES